MSTLLFQLQVGLWWKQELFWSLKGQVHQAPIREFTAALPKNKTQNSEIQVFSLKEKLLWVLLKALFSIKDTLVSSVQSLSRVRLFATPWITAHQASLSITNSRSLLKFMSIESVMPSSHLIFCCLLLLPSIPPSIGLFQWVNSSHKVSKISEFQLQHQSFQWTSRTDLL